MTNLSKAFIVADAETLGKYDDAIILSAGFTLGTYDGLNQGIPDFKSMCDEGLYLKFNVREQIAMGRKTTKSVVDWWGTQGPAARHVLAPSDEDISILELNNRLQRWVESKGYSWKQVDLWDRNAFDWDKFIHIYENHLGFAKVPWNYSKVFDIVQWFLAYDQDRYLGIKDTDVPGMVYHNALHDAVLDRIRLAKFFKGEENGST